MEKPLAEFKYQRCYHLARPISMLDGFNTQHRSPFVERLNQDSSSKRVLNILAILIFSSAAVAQTQYQMTGYILVSLFYGLFLLHIYLGTNSILVSLPKFGILFILPVYGVYLFHILSLGSTAGASIRGFSFIVFSFINLFIFVKYVSVADFLYITSRLTAIITLLGIPSYVVRVLTEETPSLYLWPYLFITTSSTGVYKYQSFFTNPNDLGGVLLIGALSSLIVALQYKRSIDYLILLTTLFGVFITQSRGTYIGLVLAVLLYIIYLKFGKVFLQTFIIGLLGLVGIIFLVITDILSTPMGSISLSNRGVLWRSGIEALVNRPLLGYGPSVTGEILEPYNPSRLHGQHVHSSFLRLFLTTGIVGGTGYLLFSLWAVFKRTGFHQHPLLVPIGVGLIVAQVFNEFSMMGVGLPSVLSSIVFGYLIQSSDRV